jgi:hypothetical protein
MPAPPPKDAAEFALRMLSIFFFNEEKLGASNCTKADGRRLLDQDILKSIKHDLT